MPDWLARSHAKSLISVEHGPGAGDIGGTNARLRLYDRTGAKRIVHEAILPSAGAPSLAAIVGGYLAGVAGARSRRPCSASPGRW